MWEKTRRDTGRFNAFTFIGTQLEKFRTIFADALALAASTKDDMARARYLREATRAAVSEVDLAMSAGLVAKNLGVLKVERKTYDSGERLPTGAELAQLFRDAAVDPSESISPAELRPELRPGRGESGLPTEALGKI